MNDNPVFYMMICIPWDLIWSAVGAVGSIATAFATIWLVIVGIKQLRGLNKTGSETFLQNLKKDFFTSEARSIVAIAENGLLEFKIGIVENGDDPKVHFGYFEIKSSSNQQLQKLLKALSTKDIEMISTYEMDDYLLQHLEDIGFLFKKKLIDIYNVDQLFGYYIETIFENPEIKKYIDWARNDSEDIYSNFEYVYHKLKLYLSKKKA